MRTLPPGRHDARPGLAACLKALQSGNTLVLWRLNRLGRDLKHLVNTAEDLRTRGVGLKVLAGAGAQPASNTCPSLNQSALESSPDCASSRPSLRASTTKQRPHTGGAIDRPVRGC